MCGEKLEKLNWTYGGSLSSSELLKILSCMPNLVFLQFIYFPKKDSNFKIDAPSLSKEEKFDIDLKNLKTLEILTRKSENFYLFTPIIKNNLTSLKITSAIDEKIIGEISKFSKLEVLIFNGCDFDEPLKIFYLLENLKNLKIFKIKTYFCIDLTFLAAFQGLKLNSLEKLNIFSLKQASYPPEFFEDISRNFPNLKELQVFCPSQKVNLFAKNFKNLEKLSLVCKDDFVELETGILNENLREFKLKPIISDDAKSSGEESDEQDECSERYSYLELFKLEDEYLECLELFPNLEVLELINENAKFLNINEKFFKKFLKLPNLKVLKIDRAFIKNCLNFIKEFKILAEKLECIEINECFFYDAKQKLLNDENEEIKTFSEAFNV